MSHIPRPDLAELQQSRLRKLLGGALAGRCAFALLPEDGNHRLQELAGKLRPAKGGLVTVARASAHYFADGWLRQVANNVLVPGPRRLFRPAVTNLDTRSDNLTHTAWDKMYCTATAADTLKDNGTSAYARARQSVSLADNLSYVLWAYVKKVDSPHFSLALHDGTANIRRAHVCFQFDANGVPAVVHQHAGTGGVETTSVLVNGEAGYLVWALVPAGVVIGANSNRIELSPSWLGDELGTQSVKFKVHQLEVNDGSNRPSAYVPTAGASASKALDQASMATLLPYQEWTAVLRAKMLHASTFSATATYLWLPPTAGNANRIKLLHHPTDGFVAELYDAGGNAKRAAHQQSFAYGADLVFGASGQAGDAIWLWVAETRYVGEIAAPDGISSTCHLGQANGSESAHSAISHLLLFNRRLAHEEYLFVRRRLLAD